VRWPCGGSPEITRAAFFSEGCALRVRVVRPHECRGLSFPIHALTMVRWPRGDMPRSNRSLPCGRAEPAPPGGLARHGWPCGGRPGMSREAFFSEGCALRVRVVRPHECRGLSFPIHALTMVRWPRGDMPRSNRSLPCGRAEPAPPRNRTPDKENERLQRRDAPVKRDPDVVWASGACSSAATERS